MSDSDAELMAAKRFAVACDIKRYAVTALRSAALADSGVTIFVHPRVITPGEGALAMQTTLNGRTAVRILAMQSVFASLATDGVRLEDMADFCAAELEAYMTTQAGAT